MKRRIERLPSVFVDDATMNNNHHLTAPHPHGVEPASATSGFSDPLRGD
jgi:hypothetical protein